MPATLVLLLALAAPSGEPARPIVPAAALAVLRQVARHPDDEARLLARVAANPSGVNPGWGTGWAHAARFGPGVGPLGLGFAAPEGQLAAQRLGVEKAKEHDARIRASIGPIVKQLQLQVTPK